MSIRDRLQLWLADQEEDCALADGFDDALIGIAQQFIAVYDREKYVQILVDRDGMDYEEANEFFEFNVQGAYVGEGTPAFLVWKVEDEAGYEGLPEEKDDGPETDDQ